MSQHQQPQPLQLTTQKLLQLGLLVGLQCGSAAGNRTLSATSQRQPARAPRLLDGSLIQTLPHAPPRARSCAAAGCFSDKNQKLLKSMLQPAPSYGWLKAEETARKRECVADFDNDAYECALQKFVFCSVEYQDWHSDMKWAQQKGQQDIKWLFNLPDKWAGHFTKAQQCVLLQPHRVKGLAKSVVKHGKELDVAQLQRFLTAASRITVQQRMQLVLAGFRTRFAQIGCCKPGDIALLQMSDISSLNLPELATDIMTTYIQQNLSVSPSMLFVGSGMTDINATTKELLDKFDLGSCLPLFRQKGLEHVKDLLTVPSTQVLDWEKEFAVKLPFRKLSRLMASLPCFVWWQRMKTNGLLPVGCSMEDLVLYGSEAIWQQVSTVRLTYTHCARPVPTVASFEKQASKATAMVTEEHKLQLVWQRYEPTLVQVFGLRTAADLRELHNGDLDDLSDFFSPAALSFLRTVCASSPIPSLQPGPTASEVKQQNATGLGDLMDWLSHDAVQLAAYHPFFQDAGIDDLEDLELLSMDTVQCFMLPWDVRRLLAALRNLLCSDAVPFGTLEPSLLCTINARTPVSDGAQYLQSRFFTNSAQKLAGIGLVHPADTLFLTESDLEKMDGACPGRCGTAWQHAASAAQQSISSSERLHALKNRFPQTLASIGLHQAGDIYWLESHMIQQFLIQLPGRLVDWLSHYVCCKSKRQWQPFTPDEDDSDAVQLQAWEKHACLKLPQCIGVRSVADLAHVQVEVHVAQTRPVQLAKLRWALCGYQTQLQQEEEAAACQLVQEVYMQYKKVHDVRGFVEQLVSCHPKLENLSLEEMPNPDSAGSPEWKVSARKFMRRVMFMVHTDKAKELTATENAIGSKIYLVLTEWKKEYED